MLRIRERTACWVMRDALTPGLGYTYWISAESTTQSVTVGRDGQVEIGGYI